MDIVNLIIGLISGGVGGNIAGPAMKDKNLGPLINSITGIIGGGATNAIFQALGMFGGTQAIESGLGSILGNVGTSGVGGAILLIIVTLIKNYLKK